MDTTYQKCGVLGLIPARGGSKRLPHKNLIQLAGQPLISYTIQAGLQSCSLDELMVSTDDHEIAQIALAWGARVPFMRPQELAQDETSTFEVVRHALGYYQQTEGKLFEYVMLLQPTSPLRNGRDIDEAMMFLHAKQADAVISVSELDHSPLWCNTLPADLSMNSFLRDDVKYKRSQELETYYRLNGAIYICRTERLLEEQTFFLQDRVYAHVMAREKSIDIDTFLDLKLCEVLLAERPTAAQAAG